MRPIVIAYHLIWTGYGWWLPNDPRGSTSGEIRNDFIADLGDLYCGRKRVQPAGSEIRAMQRAAAGRLLHPLISFGAGEVATLAEVFAKVVCENRYTCYACAIMPDHVHLLIRKHRHTAEEMIENLQDGSRLQLRETARFGQNHPIWGGSGWKVFLDHPDEVWRTIGYIENNPVHLGQRCQRWSFVTSYDNWPLHEGHDSNSPYARRLRGGGGR